MEQTIGKRIARHRKQLGMTQDQLAEKLGVTPQAVSKWENDQSCPDISILPQLADIFGTSTDALLGRAEPVHQAEVVQEPPQNPPFYIDLNWDGGKIAGIGIAVFVILVGALYLVSSIWALPVSFWNILWPCALLCLGVFGLVKKFSFFYICCALLGGWFLADHTLCLPLQLDGRIIWAVIIIMLGTSLLVDTLRKSKQPAFSSSIHGSEKMKSKLDLGQDSFCYHASFGEAVQFVPLAQLSQGEVNCNFGDYTVDLTQVTQLTERCQLQLHCNFGELKLLVPRKFTVKPMSSATFADISIEGQPEEPSQGVIYTEAHCTFGAIQIEYV